jgi:hypothetical protein
MCNLYSLNKGQDEIGKFSRTINDDTGNLPPLPGIFPDMMAPVVRIDGNGRRLQMLQAAIELGGTPRMVWHLEKQEVNFTRFRPRRRKQQNLSATTSSPGPVLPRRQGVAVGAVCTISAASIALSRMARHRRQTAAAPIGTLRPSSPSRDAVVPAGPVSGTSPSASHVGCGTFQSMLW